MIRSTTHKVEAANLTLADLRSLVEATKDASPDTHVSVHEYKTYSPTDHQNASISVTVTEVAE